MKQLKMWWPHTPRPGNFGDIMGPWLVAKLFDVNVVRGNHDDINCLFTIGSIAQKATDNTVIWGSGLMSSYSKPNTSCKYLAVRGPKTRNIILEHGGQCPEIYGDPALLAPLAYNKKINKTHSIGIFPHYVDYELINAWYGSNKEVKIINPVSGCIESTINEILSCEKIISSSLHGIIVANAYGIASKWVKFSDKLAGDGNKFLDYFASVSIEDESYDFDKKLRMHDLINFNYVGDNINYNGDKLINAMKNYLNEYNIS